MYVCMMVGNTGTLMPIRLVRSKLRKGDTSPSMAEVVSAQNTTQIRNSNNIEIHSRSSLSSGNILEYQESDQQLNPSHDAVVTFTECTSLAQSSREVSFVRTSGGFPSMQSNNWVFPPKAPTPHIYNCLNDVLISENDKSGFKGFRKQFSGRFKRFVSKKPEPAPAIPPELKPQLKTIYVY